MVIEVKWEVPAQSGTVEIDIDDLAVFDEDEEWEGISPEDKKYLIEEYLIEDLDMIFFPEVIDVVEIK